MTSAESTAIFTRSWSLYDWITEHNYMFHQEIYTGVGWLLSLREDAGRYRLLDLGCGNARYLAPCLRQSPPALYEGVDLSEAALIEARGYLADLPGSAVTLTQGDLLQAVEATGKIWDVIFTGFAVHHLSSDDKARFFQAVGGCLAENGWLILVDVVREENQSRKDYLDGYLQCMRDNWSKIPPGQLEEACTHVHDHDYPEYFSTLQEMAAAAGLQASRIVNQYGQHQTLLFARSALPDI
ncbi:trans-aconitate 2-methyltransferase [Nitrosomonas sp.]|uniref:class I SAM-dependent methyltransferase n=1 Tax=Nitrosomonas sp. TaxID=42353 RepID=UPI00272FFA2D|nr:class I SAM-dependent methyltransferase [Nitrosomonas sp.]MDP1788135.1 class I SAM-dependent methyltransferase [Nitrosomonas sp.]MDP2225267.1 class I SAM-dependent methyltransferase [Nitrosomonas sp.]